MSLDSIYLSSIILGLASSLHCLGMCGPLVMAIPITENRKSWIYRLEYLFAKSLAYGALGIMIGILGWTAHIMNWQQYLSIISGVLMIGIVIIQSNWTFKKNHFIQHRLIKGYSKFFNSQSRYKYVVMGFLNGLLPCGMIYVAMANAMASSHPLKSALAMILFGVGTMPILWLVFQFKRLFSGKYKNLLKRISLVITLLLGLMMILRGSNLGIPYLSPEVNEQGTTKCCH